MRRVRIGAVGARPNAFNTTRYSEKLLEAAGISVNTIDLSEVFGSAALIANDDARVKQRIDQIRAYADSSSAPAGVADEDGQVRDRGATTGWPRSD